MSNQSISIPGKVTLIGTNNILLSLKKISLSLHKGTEILFLEIIVFFLGILEFDSKSSILFLISIQSL